MKKFLAMLMVLCMVASLCACGSASITTTSTTTTTTTDADGNSTTTTTTTSNVTSTFPEGSCGAEAQDGEEHEVSVSIKNDTGADMTGFYICVTGETSWSNLFDEDEYLADGETAYDYFTITYSSDCMSFDLGFKNEGDEEAIECDAIDISTLPTDGFTITFGEDGWSAE